MTTTTTTRLKIYYLLFKIMIIIITYVIIYFISLLRRCPPATTRLAAAAAASSATVTQAEYRKKASHQPGQPSPPRHASCQLPPARRLACRRRQVTASWLPAHSWLACPPPVSLNRIIMNNTATCLGCHAWLPHGLSPGWPLPGLAACQPSLPGQRPLPSSASWLPGFTASAVVRPASPACLCQPFLTTATHTHWPRLTWLAATPHTHRQPLAWALPACHCLSALPSSLPAATPAT